MKNIAITQRVEVIADYNEKRDCLDQQWASLLIQAGYLPIPLFNVAILVDDYLQKLNIEGIILSGGNNIADQPKRDTFECQLIDAAIHRHIPILGVCRGLQILNKHLGGQISTISHHVANRHHLYAIDQDKTPVREVNSYHRFGIKPTDLCDTLEPLYIDEQGWVEAAINKQSNITGIMWHPEREQPFQANDINLIKEIFK